MTWGKLISQQGRAKSDASRPRVNGGRVLARRQQLSQAGIAAAALRELSLDDREAVELRLRHHLTGLGLADVLGMRPRRAHAAATRAAARLRRALGPLLVACRGREDCPNLDLMLASWDGRPAVLLDRRVRRHIRYCDTCQARERHEFPSGALAGLLARAAQPAQPPGLRDAVLRELAVTPGTAAGGNPIADLVTRRVGAFGPSGFPVLPRRGNWRTGHPQQVAGAVASVAVLGVAIVLFAWYRPTARRRRGLPRPPCLPPWHPAPGKRLLPEPGRVAAPRVPGRRVLRPRRRGTAARLAARQH